MYVYLDGGSGAPSGGDGSRLDVGSVTTPGDATSPIDRDGSVVIGEDGTTSTDTTPPSITLTSPEDGAEVDGTVAIAVQAADDVGVVRVELWVDGALEASASSSPWSLSWDAAAFAEGEHTLAVRAYDAANNMGEDAGHRVLIDRSIRETFSNAGAEDLPGWMRSAAWTLDTAADHTATAGSLGLSGAAEAASATPVTERATVTVRLGPIPKLTYWRKLELGGGTFFVSVFRVRVNGTAIEEERAQNQARTDAAWVERREIDLAAYASTEVTLTFELAASSLSLGATARAAAWIDDLRISGAPVPPPRPDAGVPASDAGVRDATPGRDAAIPPADGGAPPPSGAPYANASETVHQLRQALSLTGSYGVALTGGHLVASNAQGGSNFPRETPLSSSGRVTIPAGATVRHALLWYSAPIFMKPAPAGEGDYTADIGGVLDSAADVAANGITFSINGTQRGPYDPSSRRPPSPSSVGSESQLSPHTLDFHFGTYTGIRETVWANRLDVTGLFAGASGDVTVQVNPPERLDVNGNDSSRNGGNPAGQTTYNLCSGAASWSLLVIYEKSDLPRKNLVLLDGTWARAWDYVFFHTGEWQRPRIRIDHAPIRSGARFYTYVASGNPGGSGLPTSPACSCGCGGQYTLKNQSGGYGLNAYFSNTYVDPPQAASDPMHRDKNNGPWYLHPGDLGRATTGNDWTLFQSGAVYTEFPNLYEGELSPGADTRQPVTHEDDPAAAHDVYGGHPWAGRGSVTYHASGNAVSVVEIALDNARITPGETSSYVYLKGDQKDVWKPQHIVSMKWLLFETPVQ